MEIKACWKVYPIPAGIMAAAIPSDHLSARQKAVLAAMLAIYQDRS